MPIIDEDLMNKQIHKLAAMREVDLLADLAGRLACAKDKLGYRKLSRRRRNCRFLTTVQDDMIRTIGEMNIEGETHEAADDVADKVMWDATGPQLSGLLTDMTGAAVRLLSKEHREKTTPEELKRETAKAADEVATAAIPEYKHTHSGLLLNMSGAAVKFLSKTHRREEEHIAKKKGAEKIRRAKQKMEAEERAFHNRQAQERLAEEELAAEKLKLSAEPAATRPPDYVVSFGDLDTNGLDDLLGSSDSSTPGLAHLKLHLDEAKVAANPDDSALGKLLHKCEADGCSPGARHHSVATSIGPECSSFDSSSGGEIPLAGPQAQLPDICSADAQQELTLKPLAKNPSPEDEEDVDRNETMLGGWDAAAMHALPAAIDSMGEEEDASATDSLHEQLDHELLTMPTIGTISMTRGQLRTNLAEMIPKLLTNNMKVYQQALPKMREELIRMDPKEKVNAQELSGKFPEVRADVLDYMLQTVDWVDKITRCYSSFSRGYVFKEFATMLDDTIELDFTPMTGRSLAGDSLDSYCSQASCSDSEQPAPRRRPEAARRLAGDEDLQVDTPGFGCGRSILTDASRADEGMLTGTGEGGFPDIDSATRRRLEGDNDRQVDNSGIGCGILFIFIFILAFGWLARRFTSTKRAREDSEENLQTPVEDHDDNGQEEPEWV